MKQMHSLLRRQLKRFFGSIDKESQELQAFVNAVNEAYQEFDVDREMLERSLELSSQEMLQTNAEMRAIFSALPDVIFTLDASGTILECEAGNVDDLLIVPKDKILGKRIQDIPFTEVGDKFQEAISRVKETKSIVGIEYSLQIKENINFYEARLVPFLDHQVIAIIRNITESKLAAEELRKAEERFRSLIEKATDIITIIAKDGTIRYQSPSSMQVLGYHPEELVGQNVLDLVHPDDLPRVAAVLSLDMPNVDNISVEFRCQHKDGSWRILEGVTRNLFAHPVVAGIVINARDITDRKKAEEAHHQSENLYRSIFENTGTAMVIINEDDIISLFNKKAEELTGYSAEEVLGIKTWQEFMPEEDLQKIRESRTAQIKKSETGPRQYEFHLLRKDGELRDVFLTIDFIIGSNKRVASIIDLTDLRKTEKALQESEEKYRLLVENSSDSIFIVQEGVIKFPNRAALMKGGFSEEELATGPFINLVHPDDRNSVMKLYEKTMQGEKSSEILSFRIKNKSGEELWVEITAVPILWQGKAAAIAFLRDITEQKRLESQLLQAQKMEAIGTLAGGIAHDFNNLLMGVQGYASFMLLNEERSHADYEMLKAIEQQVQSGAELTKQLLGFAMGGKYEIKPTDLNELVKKTSTIFGRTKKDVAIHRRLNDDLWTVEVDRGQIEQALLNLYVNAWQAMPGGGNLYLETKNLIMDENFSKSFELKAGRYVKLSVVDTGIGMDEKTKERIFEPFFTTKQMGRGTGLGLASVYGIIKNHKGAINVYSEKGHGATFNIYLPASEKEAVKEKSLSAKVHRGHETILLVDDEKIIIDVTQRLLKKLGYKVLIAENGKMALELYEKHKDEINLVILDMTMPEMSGKDTFLSLKAIDPKVKVVLSSGYSLNQQVTEVMEQGCLAFIQKPFDIVDLSDKLGKIFGHP